MYQRVMRSPFNRSENRQVMKCSEPIRASSYLVACLICGPAERKPNIKAGTPRRIAPPLFVPGPLNVRFWHLAFNRLAMVNEDLVRGREDIFFGAEYAAWAGTPLPEEVVNYYIDRLASDPEALRGSFELYRALDVDFEQSEERKSRRLRMPVLVIGGTASVGDLAAEAMKLVADDVQTVIIDGSGHWLAEEAPGEFLAALRDFLAPYREGGQFFTGLYEVSRKRGLRCRSLG